MKAAYYYNPSMDPTMVVFDIMVDVTSLQITGFAFTPKSRVDGGTLFNHPEFKDLQGPNQQWYRVIFTSSSNAVRVSQSIHRNLVSDTANEFDRDAPFPEWPWIAAELTRSDPTSASIMGKKWDLLLTAVENQRKEHPEFLSEFVAPPMELEKVLKIDRMEEWYKKMVLFDTWGTLLKTGYLEKTLNGI